MPQANVFLCYPDFFIRTPAFPLDCLADIPAESKDLLPFLRKLWKNPIIKSAIILASPALLTELNSELESPDPPQKLLLSFLRYYIRMCSRCTPFGLFAGVGTGVISDKSEIKINSQSQHSLRCRIDMEYLGNLVMKFSRDNEIRNRLFYRSNTSLYFLGDKWRYIEIYFLGDAKKRYRIVSLESDPLINEVIASSETNRACIDLIRQVADYGYDIEEAAKYINGLIECQVLVPDIFPNLTGKEFSSRLKNRLSVFSKGRSDISNFLSLIDILEVRAKQGSLYDLYPEILSLADNTGIEYHPSHLIQADLLSSYENAEIDLALTNRVLLGIRILKAISRPKENIILQKFKKHFIHRFGNHEVPLTHVMDTEFGVALSGPQGQQMADPSPLLEGLDFKLNMIAESFASPHPLLANKLKTYEPHDSLYIELEKADVNHLGLRKGHWPEQVYVLCRLLGDKVNPSIVLDHASAGNPSNIMGRFGLLEKGGRLDKHIRKMINDDADNHPEHILADLVHLPEDRTGNILQRPSYYDWEITYLASPGQEDCLISPDDILVSVFKDEIVLKHKISKRRILPRLTNAHNFKYRQLPLYQFLAECVNQYNSPAFSPNWGWLSSSRDFLPGIRYEQLILSPPLWRIRIDKSISNSKMKGEKLYRLIQAWVGDNNLPDQLVWVDGDHELFVDWSNFNIALSVWDSIRKRKNVFFKYFPFDKGSPVKGSDGEYANEILFSYKKAVE